MIQRTLFAVIQQGLAAFATNPGLYQNLFIDQWGLAQSEVDGIQATFTKKPINVQHGYQLADVSPPLVAILLQGESQSDYALGDQIGVNSYLGAGGVQQTAPEIGSVWEATFQILCFTDNIDATSYLYEMVKAALMYNRIALQQTGIMDPMLSGMDLAPDNRYLPEHLFARALSLRCKKQFGLTDYSQALASGLVVKGMALPPGTSQPNGGVMTLASTY